MMRNARFPSQKRRRDEPSPAIVGHPGDHEEIEDRQLVQGTVLQEDLGEVVLDLKMTGAPMEFPEELNPCQRGVDPNVGGKMPVGIDIE